MMILQFESIRFYDPHSPSPHLKKEPFTQENRFVSMCLILFSMNKSQTGLSSSLTSLLAQTHPTPPFSK